ncbi:hypothetical protein X949_5937 [Burkholderia pseudomallei MSHR5609]|nr:hypothetical protein X949_5937 [Burkholderia pseudomallei MSHR5609]
MSRNGAAYCPMTLSKIRQSARAPRRRSCRR